MKPDSIVRAANLLNACILACIIFVLVSVFLLFNPPSENISDPKEVKASAPLLPQTVAVNKSWLPPDSTKIPLTP